MHKTIGGLFDIPTRFLRSVQIERDFHDVAACKNYIVTPPMADAFLRIAEGLAAGSGRRAWRITGDYGVGKSSFALVLAHLLFDRSPPDISKIARAIDWPKRIPPMFPVLVTGSREGIIPAIARGISEALRKRRAQPGRVPQAVHDIVSFAEDVERSGDLKELEKLIGKTRQHAGDNGQGVLLVMDELGKNLEHAAQRPEFEDVYVLQRLAELAARSGDRAFVLLGLLHQGFHAYAESLPSAVRHEWEKVAGRFDEIVFDQPLAHTAALVSGALNIDLRRVPESVCSAARRAANAAASAGWIGSTKRSLELFGSGRTYPLHPTVLPAVVRFFARFGQHERSLFGFLLSTEPFGIQSFSIRATDAGTWYDLSEFYDYVRAVFGHKLAGASYRNQWLRILETIDGTHDLSPLAERLLKAIGVLNLLDADDLAATQQALVAAFVPNKEREVAAALKELTDAGLVFRRGPTGAYRLWPHSSVNLEGAFETACRALGSLDSVADGLLPFLDREPLLARRHYVESGTMRYFEVRYAKVDALSQATVKSTDADGLLIIALPDSEVDRTAAIEASTSPAFAARNDVVLGIPRPLRSLAVELQDLKRWRWVAENTPELSGDAYALAEVTRQTASSHRALNAKATKLVGTQGRAVFGTDWFLSGQKVVLPPRGGASALLSEICDSLYPQSPLITNELLNRNSLSSAAAAARMRLIEGLFTSGDKPLFGMDVEKAPPEKSMYLSVLQKGGIHVRDEHGLKIVEPTKETDVLRLRPALDGILGKIERAHGGRVSVADILSDLKGRPFGVRAGVAPLLLAILLQTRGHELAVYEHGTFLHRMRASDFLRLTKSPGTFEIQHCRVEGIRIEVFNHLAATFAEGVDGKRRPDLLDVVRPLCQFAAQLPESTRRSTALSGTATAVREALLSAREPVVLLFHDLPQACGMAKFDPNDAPNAALVLGFVASLQDAIGEMRGAYPALLDRIVSSVSTSIGEEGESFDRAKLAARAARVTLAAREPRLRTFALRLRDPGLSDETWAEALASYVVSKPPARWIPGDETRFCEEISALAELFKKVEAAAFGAGGEAPSPTAVRLNLTRGDGVDLVRVIEPRLKEDAATTELFGVFNNLLPKDQQARIDVLARLLWAELGGTQGTDADSGSVGQPANSRLAK
jgi:hypothetical protein